MFTYQMKAKKIQLKKTIIFLTAAFALSAKTYAFNSTCDFAKPYTTYPRLPGEQNLLSFYKINITGNENIRVTQREKDKDTEIFVKYPKGSYDPGTMKKLDLPVGGAVFRSPLETGETDCIFLYYTIQFTENFQFGRGGKLPGLYGGIPISGGARPDGENGFTVRIKWDKDGYGSPYAYIPEKKTSYGETFDSKAFLFTPGQKHKIIIFLKLNDPGKSNGVLNMWQDGVLKFTHTTIRYRNSENLKISGFLFSTFFGGHSPEDASPIDNSATFSEIKLSNHIK